MSRKPIDGIYPPPSGHWVGDGFPVRPLFLYDRQGADKLSPFLMLDYAGPADFPPAPQPRGVGPHPHRGFETVTLVFEGELAHRDSTGAGGLIGPGDVQWMTAGAGILHEEFHSQGFTQNGGRLESVQLWVNLPAEHKSAPANYQTLLKGEIPDVSLPQGRLRVVAGEFQEHRGPAHTFSPMNVWDFYLEDGAQQTLAVPEGHNTLFVLLSGAVDCNGESLNDTQLLRFGTDGTDIQLTARGKTHALILSGEPLREPVVGYGPFVMNSRDEIQQAVRDFQSGRFGVM